MKIRRLGEWVRHESQLGSERGVSFGSNVTRDVTSGTWGTYFRRYGKKWFTNLFKKKLLFTLLS